jgi:molybdopterin-guanine dinucleotide biosynthesis protein A
MGGVDKPLLPLADRTILDFVLQRVAPQVGALMISANGNPDRFARFGLPVYPDELAGRGPLGGLLRGLHWAEALGAEALLTVPGDTPFVPADLVARLGAAPACAENAAGVHWPVAVWPVGCAGALAGWLGSQKSGRVSAFGEVIGMRRVWFAEAGDPFQNINTPEDLEAARRSV